MAVYRIMVTPKKKRFDVLPGKTSPTTQYWINVACDPAVFEELKSQGIKPYAFLADFEAEGKAIKTVQESMVRGQPGMMSIQGGTMAGLRAANLADALGFREMEYFGFDATVQLTEGKARPYAYEKKRGEAIIEIMCDRCSATFNSTLIFQRQVNEFLSWRSKMPWMNFTIIGGGLVDHYVQHVAVLEQEDRKARSKERFTEAYSGLQALLHAEGDYGVTGKQHAPVIFHAVSQLAKRHGSISVLDYGSAAGTTFDTLKELFWLPPGLTLHCYDPFVHEFCAEPTPADFVMCLDVMEHVEPQCTWAVLDHIASLTKRVVFFTIGLVPAQKVLADGRNAHINLRSQEFWLKEIRKRFITSEVALSKDQEAILVVAQAIDDVREILRKEKRDLTIV